MDKGLSDDCVCKGIVPCNARPRPPRVGLVCMCWSLASPPCAIGHCKSTRVGMGARSYNGVWGGGVYMTQLSSRRWLRTRPHHVLRLVCSIRKLSKIIETPSKLKTRCFGAPITPSRCRERGSDRCGAILNRGLFMKHSGLKSRAATP